MPGCGRRVHTTHCRRAWISSSKSLYHKQQLPLSHFILGKLRHSGHMGVKGSSLVAPSIIPCCLSMRQYRRGRSRLLWGPGAPKSLPGPWGHHSFPPTPHPPFPGPQAQNKQHHDLPPSWLWEGLAASHNSQNNKSLHAPIRSPPLIHGAG